MTAAATDPADPTTGGATTQPSALIAIDVQAGFDDPVWGVRNNLDAEARGLRLLAHWRTRGWPVVIVRHDSTELRSPLRAGQAGNDLKPGFEPLPGELLVAKRVHSAFIGTGLEPWLRERGLSAVTLFGITTDQCVSTTTRMANNLGFRATVVEDACACFAQTSPDGGLLGADLMHRAHITTLATEFARVVSTDEAVGANVGRSAVEPPPGVVTSIASLRELVSPPSELVRKKVLNRLDPHARAFIAQSPMVMLGTHGHDGQVDVSPRGDPPGFVKTHGDRWMLIPERPGNRRADTLRNVIETGEVGLLFMVPGMAETLRVNGRAWVTTAPELLAPMAVEGKVPELGIAVRVRENYLHCGRCTHRARFWDPATWPPPGALPPLARMLVDQVEIPGLEVDVLATVLDEMYAKELY
jgi:PPOX class probable FMN-dependent enzyme